MKVKEDQIISRVHLDDSKILFVVHGLNVTASARSQERVTLWIPQQFQ